MKIRFNPVIEKNPRPSRFARVLSARGVALTLSRALSALPSPPTPARKTAPRAYFPPFKLNRQNRLTKQNVNAIIFRHSLGGVAQLVERLICIQEVLGSNPCISTTPARGTRGVVAQLVRAHA